MRDRHRVLDLHSEQIQRAATALCVPAVAPVCLLAMRQWILMHLPIPRRELKLASYSMPLTSRRVLPLLSLGRVAIPVVDDAGQALDERLALLLAEVTLAAFRSAKEIQ